ncbi:MAG: DUF2231 domain-containing protein [Nocardioides sp.]
MTHLDTRPEPTTRAPDIVRWTQRLETSRALNGPVRRLEPLASALLRDDRRSDALHGMWLGHAIHPALSDVPIGAWTSATLLDLLGGEQARPAAQRLVGLGILTAVPTAITGLAEWGTTETLGDRRVGAVHAMSNSLALWLYVASWLSRRQGRHGRGAALSLVAATATGVGAYLGGHLANVRHVSSRHPAYDDATTG